MSRHHPVLLAESLGLGLILALAFAVRCVVLEQPIVENYVGRQIPTAMVARNLERGSGFLNPTVDVGPFPNRFLIEPPIYGVVSVASRRVLGLSLAASGRVVSACGIVLAGWGLFGLARRRESSAVALLAVAIFAMEPVTIRYGRAFQPDALMLGCVVAGMRLLDGRTHGRFAAGWGLLALGLALKLTSAFVLIPVVVVLLDGPFWKRILVASGTMIPAAAWYVFAWSQLGFGATTGSRAALDNHAIWLSVLIPTAWARGETYRHIARFFLMRAFTPLGPPLALWGLAWVDPRGARLWRIWGASALAALAVLAAKLHHEYYWLALAPVLALGVARALVAIGGTRPWLAGTLGVIGLALSAGFSSSTWRTPTEWRSLRATASEVRLRVPREAWIVAPEALLFEADRRGCRLELTNAAARRAAGEWPDAESVNSPLELVRFYQSRGARYFADVRPEDASSARLALHEAIRSRYNVEVDRSGIFLARLTPLPP